jgi:hypothetical protein
MRTGKTEELIKSYVKNPNEEDNLMTVSENYIINKRKK